MSTDSTVCPGDRRYTCVNSPNRNLSSLAGSFTSAPFSTFSLRPSESETLMTILCLTAILSSPLFLQEAVFLTCHRQEKGERFYPLPKKPLKIFLNAFDRLIIMNLGHLDAHSHDLRRLCPGVSFQADQPVSLSLPIRHLLGGDF